MPAQKWVRLSGVWINLDWILRIEVKHTPKEADSPYSIIVVMERKESNFTITGFDSEEAASELLMRLFDGKEV